MESRAHDAVVHFRKALARLSTAVDSAVDELDRDGVIQRFEFTFEMLWKAVRALLEHEGFECAGPRSCIKEGARRGLVVDGEILLDMLADRNKTSHIYEESLAEQIHERIERHYQPALERNAEAFEKYLRNAT